MYIDTLLLWLSFPKCTPTPALDMTVIGPFSVLCFFQTGRLCVLFEVQPLAQAFLWGRQTNTKTGNSISVNLLLQVQTPLQFLPGLDCFPVPSDDCSFFFFFLFLKFIVVYKRVVLIEATPPLLETGIEFQKQHGDWLRQEQQESFCYSS